MKSTSVESASVTITISAHAHTLLVPAEPPQLNPPLDSQQKPSFHSQPVSLLSGFIVKRVQALFWDVGGVLLTNAWDHEERGRAVDRFQVDTTEFERRHKEVVAFFEEGRIGLDEYLERTVFYQPRDFTREDFKSFMFSLSKPKSEVLELARGLANKCLMGTINNESRELNQYRIQRFGLLDIFELFVSSCFVGIRKPEPKIYRLALDLIQKTPEECCFIDDRPINIEGAAKVGMRAVQMQNVAQLKKDLQNLGVEL
jgi:putative hydrolase of the HAD superfamily